MRDVSSEELQALRHRAYGPDADIHEDPVALERLRELENGEQDVATTAPEVLLPNPSVVQDQVVADVAKPPRHPLGHLSWRGWLVAVAVASALALLGFGVGVTVASPAQAEALPEFNVPQTEEDVLPLNAIDPSVDPASTRFIAQIDGYAIFLAQPAEFEGICIVSLPVGPTQPQSVAEPQSIGCAAGTGVTGGARFGVGQTLEIAVGEAGAPEQGVPVRLSESITAYRR